MWDMIRACGSPVAPTLTTGVPDSPRRFVPVTSTRSVLLPTTTPGGVKPVIFGATRKFAVLVLVPMELVRITRPVSASGGMTT